MPTLHALLIGINAYPNPNHVLRGCLNDVQHMHEYLESYCKSLGFVYRPLILTDKAATRQAVIDSFDHFQAASAEDCCLFHFSGHGSRSEAPEVFWHLESDHKLESLVCWDSRQAGGHDLMDKELSYLIWRTTREREFPFVTIMDCCHSGDMRTIQEQEHDQQLEVLAVRALRDIGSAPMPDQLLGIEHYKKSAHRQWSPPLGRRVHLGAARNTEYAKEVNAGGQPRGIFTYCLIEALQRTGPLVSYADLLNAVNLRIRQNVKEQSAQLGATHIEDRNRGFLLGPIDNKHSSYLVSWDKESNGWMLNAGALQGIPEGDADSRTILEMAIDGHLVTVEGVLPNQSKVSGMDGYNTRQVYFATIKRRATPKLTLAFAPGSDPQGVELLSGLIESKNSDLFRLSGTSAGNGYQIYACNTEYFLSRIHDDTPLFQREAGFTETAAAAFLRKLDSVANWQQLLELHNPDTGIRDSELEINLFRLTEAKSQKEMDNDVPIEPLDWQTGPVSYSYFKKNDQAFQPAFQLKLRNTGHRPLWVSLLYLGSDFSITNALMPKQMLRPGDAAWALDVADSYPYRTIPLQIEDNRLDTIDEYLKVLICTGELDTDRYCQKGLAAYRDNHQTVGFRQQPQERDWAAKTITVKITR